MSPGSPHHELPGFALRATASLGTRMELKQNDWVKTPSGDIGKVVHISRLTVFVAFPVPDKADLVQAYLESQLTKVNRPSETGKSNSRSAH